MVSILLYHQDISVIGIKQANMGSPTFFSTGQVEAACRYEEPAEQFSPGSTQIKVRFSHEIKVEDQVETVYILCTKHSRLLAVGSGAGLVEELEEGGGKWSQVPFEASILA